MIVRLDLWVLVCKVGNLWPCWVILELDTTSLSTPINRQGAPLVPCKPPIGGQMGLQVLVGQAIHRLHVLAEQALHDLILQGFLSLQEWGSALSAFPLLLDGW